MRAIRLRTEYLKEPIGIDFERPRLFWNCEGGMTQTAYQIVAEDDSGALLWDSGRIECSSMRARWGGEAVPPRTRVLWRVLLWDENGLPGQWSGAMFETGLPSRRPWKADWITGNYRVNKKHRYPVDCFRKIFSVSGIKKARLYITACGLYEARLNGQRAGDFVLAPGHTDYGRRVQYQTYDVTALLKNGENILTVQLADGWFRGSVGAWGRRNQYGTETKLLAQLEITCSDGSVRTVCSDESWEWSNDGPIRFADNKDGELVDARREPGYSGKAKVTEHNVIPTAANNVPVVEHERLLPRLITTSLGNTVLDFGQNLAGYVAFTVQAGTGQRIFLRFGELLDENGEFTQKNIQCSNKRITTPLQQVEYFCRQGENHYKTTFAVFGFRYVLVETDVTFRPEDFTAIAVYSDMERTGRFVSSNPLLNKFVEATVWSAKSNFADIPTDCPTRERHGWTGDAQIFFETACYLFDGSAFFEKYLNDIYDWQRSNGRLPQIAPAGGVDFYMNVMHGSVGWADAGILIPYRFWKLYGDEEILRTHYEGMKKYASFMISRCGRWGGPYAKPLGIKGPEKKYLVNRGQSYGEWAEPADIHIMKWIDFAEPHPEVSTAYTAYVMGIMEEIAEVLGKTEDFLLYREYRRGCTGAYQSLAETPRFTLDTERQARLVRPLAFRLLTEQQSEFAEKRLVQALKHYGWRLGTGFLSTPLILDVLAEYNLDAAYRLLENEEMPGWLFMAKNGATTVWESWEGTQAQSGIASLNHYSKGAVCEWLFKTMCGIRVDGENHFIIAPRPGGHFTYAKAEYTSVYGTVESGWRREETGCRFEVNIPSNTTAEILLPDGMRYTVQSGLHSYIWTPEIDSCKGSGDMLE